ncbi:DnaA ATPase domain-containing protein [Brochothrix campestris]|nr:DnaA/Hda family protein [Brochothrix campestris]
MQIINETSLSKLSRAISNRARPIGEHCDEHPHVHKWELDNEDGSKFIYCPICDRDKRNREQQMEVMERLLVNSRGRLEPKQHNYSMLRKKSLVGDVSTYRASISSYVTKQHEQEQAIETSKEVIKRAIKGEAFSYWLIGNAGVGKSHIAWGILNTINEYTKANKKCLYLNVPKMFDKIYHSFNNKESNTTQSYFIELVTEADVVVLDDLGAETGTVNSNNAASNFTTTVLNKITSELQTKPSIITTNLSKDELVNMYDARTVSRLMANIKITTFKNTLDYRVKAVDW